METVQLARPVGGNRTRFRRPFVCLVLAFLMLGAGLPAQAGLGDLIDDLLDPIDDLPVVDEVLDPVDGLVDTVVDDVVAPIIDPPIGAIGEIVEPVVGEVVEPVLDQVLTPVVEGAVQPILEEVIPPVVEDPVPPPIEEILPPPVDDVAPPPIESVLDPETLSEPALAGPGNQAGQPDSLGEPPSQVESGRANPEAGESLLLAQSVQMRLAVDGSEAREEIGSPSSVVGRQVDTASLGWLDGLMDWLRGAADGLLSILALPVRLFEILIRALLTAGSGLVAPASLLLIFTGHAIRDRKTSRHLIST